MKIRLELTKVFDLGRRWGFGEDLQKVLVWGLELQSERKKGLV
jgi:hypothetical protein